ncbi:MAG TPA: CBS domain-containing protein [Trebonia sp.]|nr:CBS domain-containing protein [Trebonia sp.]
MARTDTHLDGMLRHLGAAYYESLHGRATQADVTRALNTVAERLSERTQLPASGAADVTEPAAQWRRAGHEGLHGWARRVSDVMATSVVTVDRATSYKEIARLLAEHRISGMPVLKMGREVAGVVTEADLLAAEAKTVRRLRTTAGRLGLPHRVSRHPVFTAGELMSAPAITVGPNVTIHAAGRLMSNHRVRLMPVVDERNRLIGVVSRRDLLAVFLRPDEDIAADVRQVLEEILLAEPAEAEVSVRDGIVTLTGTLDPKTGEHGDLIPVAIRLMWDVDGVVDIIDHLGQPSPASVLRPHSLEEPDGRGSTAADTPGSGSAGLDTGGVPPEAARPPATERQTR